MAGRKHAFLVAGTHSGCGKTTVALGLIAALKSRGLRIQPFKTGPDFIDPGLHAKIAGAPSRNLDGWMLSRSYNVETFKRLMTASDVGIVEGVMGLFDGYEGGSESGSSAEMAKWLGIPAILIVDARSMARSAAALLHGYKNFDPALNVGAVVFNRIGGPAHLEYLKEAVEASFPGFPVLGGIPREESVQIPERHLGLVTADEMSLDLEWQKRLADLIERRVNLDLLLESARYAEAAGGPAKEGEIRETGNVAENPAPANSNKAPVIAVARDAAFCFYYPDNLELLEQFGAVLEYFSPVAGQAVPGGCSGIYLGGGYPELFAEAISKNRAFLESIRSAAASGMPIYAECGGLMTLGRFIDAIGGERFEMAGILPFGTRMLARRRALGYTEAAIRKSCLLGEPGLKIRGHEFHYSEIVDETDPSADAGTGDFCSGLEFAYELRARKFERVRNEGYMPLRVPSGSGPAAEYPPRPQVLASYIHLHWGSAPGAARGFVARCAEWNNRRN